MNRMFFLITLLFLFFSKSVFGQNFNYSVSAGTNYNYFTFDFPSEINSKHTYSTINLKVIDYWEYEHLYTSLIQIKQIRSSGKLGFNINGNISFPIGNKLVFNTGIGLSNSKINYAIDFSIIDLFETKIKDNEIFLSPFFNSNMVFMDTLLFSNYPDSLKTINTEYSISKINIPLLFQIKLLKEKLFISSGVSFSIIGRKAKTYNINSIEFSANSDFDFEQTYINFHSKIEYQLYKNIYISLSFIKGITSIKRMQEIVVPKRYYYFVFDKRYTKVFSNSLNFGFTYKF